MKDVRSSYILYFLYGGDRMNRKKYRRWLIVVFIIYICAFLYYLSYTIHTSIPDVWKLTVGEEETLNFNLPLTMQANGESLTVASINGEKVPSDQINLNLNKPVSVNIEEKGTYHFSLRWMGFHLKDVEVDVVDEMKLMPLAMPVGIYIRTKGVMVLGTGTVTTYDGDRVEPAEDVLQSGDYILAVGNEPIQSIDDLTDILEQWNGGDMLLKILRNDETVEVRVTPVRTEDSKYKIGVWIRQDAQGIGTLSYVDSKNNFAALGHSITDVDTSQRIDISGGRLYQSNILSIVKGQNGVPGEMVGNIDYRHGQILGKIESNNDNGIFGTLSDDVWLYDESQALPVGFRHEVEKGPATVRCCVDGEVRDYDVAIESLELGGSGKNRDMVIKITDEELLNTTNGIVQGMSGSPIIQNNKIIGAVTHVFVNDSTKGYGIFIENMLEH